MTPEEVIPICVCSGEIPDHGQALLRLPVLAFYRSYSKITGFFYLSVVSCQCRAVALAAGRTNPVPHSETKNAAVISSGPTKKSRPTPVKVAMSPPMLDRQSTR